MSAASSSSSSSPIGDMGEVFGIKSIARERILAMVRGVVPEKKQFKVLIVDKQSLSIISAACSMYDIMKEGVSLADDISIRRQPLPKNEAIYFLSPCEESVQGLLDDFDKTVDERRKVVMYGACHVFFTSGLPDDLLAKIGENRSLVRRMRTLKELNLEFRAVDRYSFHLALRSSFLAFYSPTEEAKRTEFARTVVRQLSTLCVTLGERPYVRYQAQSMLAKHCASKLNKELRRLQKQIATFPSVSPKEGDPVTTLLLVDRSVDPLTPFLHEFTYGAMVYDLLPVNVERYSFEREYTDSTNRKNTKVAVLDESDKLWVQFRYDHIAHVTKQVVSQWKAFAAANRQTQQMSRGEAQLSKGNKGLRELSETMKKIPEYQDMMSKYSLHMDMAAKAMDQFDLRHLARLGLFEQDLVMGTLDAKSPFKALRNALQGEVSKKSRDGPPPPAISNREDRFRVLAIYFLTQPDLNKANRQEICQELEMTASETAALENIALLEIDFLRRYRGRKSGSKKDDRKKKGKSKRRKALEKNNEKAEPFEMSRYVPELRYLVDDLMKSRLPVDRFPFAGSVPKNVVQRESAGGVEAASSSSKGVEGGAKWASNKRQSRSPNTASDSVTLQPSSEGRVIVFVMGGCTMSEIRAMHEIMQQNQREVFIGSTHFTTPTLFKEDLESLN